MWTLSSAPFSCPKCSAHHCIRGNIRLAGGILYALLSKSDIDFRAHVRAISKKRTRNKSRTPLHALKLRLYVDEASIYQKTNT
jgi:hypothetical protein